MQKKFENRESNLEFRIFILERSFWNKDKNKKTKIK